MKFVNLSTDASREEVLEMISDSNRVNQNVNFDPKLGKPLMKTKEKNGKIRITCELLERGKKDNGFIVGTFFTGKITEKNGKTVLKGVALTAPVYHLIMLALLVVFIVQCIRLNGFSVVPIFILLFEIMLFKDEFKKQGLICRYLARAFRKLEKKDGR